MTDERKELRSIMIIPKSSGDDEDYKVMTKAKLWLRSRDIEPIDMTITMSVTGKSRPVVSAKLSFWDRVLFSLNFWGKLKCEAVKVFG